VAEQRRHEAWIYDQGGRTPLFRLHGPSEIKYSRVRDDTSTASVTIKAKDVDRQRTDLNSIEPGRHELHIFRTATDELAWCGPVNLPENDFGSFTCSANDVSFYWDRTAMQSAYDNSSTKADYVVNRIEKILRSELARKEQWWNLLEHLHFYVQTGDARTTALTKRYAMTVFDHIDGLAARSGIDYTIVGREQHFWDTSRPAMGQGPSISRADFTSEPSVKKYGSELATRVIATDGDGGFGISGGTDPYYGEWDIIVQEYDAETDSAKPTQAELNSQANLSRKGRNPTPLNLTVPENTSIDPRSPLYNLDLLVPGLYLPLQLDVGGESGVERMQKLQNVLVTDNAKGESIAISLYPAAGFGADDGLDGLV
jgi:hypothetical protein